MLLLMRHARKMPHLPFMRPLLIIMFLLCSYAPAHSQPIESSEYFELTGQLPTPPQNIATPVRKPHFVSAAGDTLTADQQTLSPFSPLPARQQHSIIAQQQAAISQPRVKWVGNQRISDYVPAPYENPDWNACRAEITAAEEYYGIPIHLLYAIAMVESGKFGVPWPWTIHHNGHAVYASNAQEAAKYMTDRIGQPHNNMAVGCMQIFTRYHLHAFNDVWSMLSPRNNVWYAAAFLADLRQRHGNWTDAVAFYHASKQPAQRQYVCRVLKFYRLFHGLPQQGNGDQCMPQRMASLNE